VPDASREAGDRWLPSVALTITASTIGRLLFAMGLGYAVDEAYAVTVARPLSLSYFDHPPLHFWMAAFTTWATGVSTPWIVRLPFIAAFTVTLVATAELTRTLFGERAARAATLALAVSGVLGVTSGTWVLPDGPLLAAATLAAWVMVPLFVPTAQPVHRGARWLAGGALLGLALLAKYHAALYLAALGGLTLLRRDTRADLRTPWPWLAMGLALFGLVPTLVWNAQHDWISFRFQGARAAASHWSPAPFFTMLGGEIAWLLPWVAVPLGLATVQAVRHVRQSAALAYCLTWMAGPVGLFTAVSAGGAATLPHWTAPGWLFGMPLVGWWYARAAESGRWPRRWVRLAPLATIGAVTLLLAQSTGHVLDRWLSPRARATEPTRDARSWAPALSRDTTELLLVRSWIQGGQLGSASGIPRAIVCLCADPHQFAFRANRPHRWTHGTLVERVQPWKRDWRPAPEALAGDSLRIVVRDSVRVDDAVLLVRYDVTRRALGATRSPAPATSHSAAARAPS
jgi:hypothetical protein